MSQICLILILILNLLLLTLSSKAGSSSTGSLSILRQINKTNNDEVHHAVDITARNFDAVLKNTPATYAIVEFFIQGGDACRKYKPHYEKVASIFNGPDAVHPGIILMTRVDCLLKINIELCHKFSVRYYPMIFWGPASKFVSGGWEPRQEKSDIRLIDDGRTVDCLLNWINEHLGSSYGLADQKFENEHLGATTEQTQSSQLSDI